MLDVTYGFYTDTYHGTLAEDDFERALVYASAWLDDLTMGRVSDGLSDDMQQRVRLAVCAAVDARSTNEKREGVSSESNDGVSVSYVTGGAGGASAVNIEARRLYEAAVPFLAGTGLLYRGVM